MVRYVVTQHQISRLMTLNQTESLECEVCKKQIEAGQEIYTNIRHESKFKVKNYGVFHASCWDKLQSEKAKKPIIRKRKQSWLQDGVPPVPYTF